MGFSYTEEETLPTLQVYIVGYPLLCASKMVDIKAKHVLQDLYQDHGHCAFNFSINSLNSNNAYSNILNALSTCTKLVARG